MFELYECFYDDMTDTEIKTLVRVVYRVEDVEEFLENFSPVTEHHWREHKEITD